MSTATGVVEFVYEKGGIYSIKLDDGQFYGCYKTKPNCEKGDTVSFDYKENGKYFNAEPKSLSVLDSAPKQDKKAAPAGKKAVDWDAKDRSIQFQAARNSAIALLAIAVPQDAIKLPAAANKKFDALLALVDELTVRYYGNSVGVYDGGQPFADVTNDTDAVDAGDDD